MKKLVSLLVLVFSLSIFAQTKKEIIPSLKYPDGREILIKLPPSYSTNKEKKYPLILVLDGDYLFSPFDGNLTYGNYWDDMPEVILVGIGQAKKGQREKDSEFDLKTGLPLGNGATFFEFIGAELIPYLEKKYRLTPFKVIAGLDMTAGFLNYFLYKENPLFNAYICMSPELSSGMETRIADRLSTMKQPIYYYLSTADGDLKKISKQVKILDSNLKPIKTPNINYKFDDFQNATHYSLVLNSIPSALNQIFKVYQPITSVEYQETIVKLPYDYVVYLNKKYEMIEKNFGVKMNVRLNDFKAIETAVLKNEAYNEFEQLAQISGQQFPKTMLYDYHMGMYYEKRGEIKKAIRNYENAFTKEEIGGLNKGMMMDKAVDLKKLLPKKASKKGKQDDIEEPLDTPVDAPVEETTDQPVEEKKPK
jgi:uncharacterized protein